MSACLGCGLRQNNSYKPVLDFCFTDPSTGCPVDATPPATAGTAWRRDPSSGCLWFPPVQAPYMTQTSSFADIAVGAGGNVTVGSITQCLTNTAGGPLRVIAIVSMASSANSFAAADAGTLALDYTIDGGTSWTQILNRPWLTADGNGLSYIANNTTYVPVSAIAAGGQLCFGVRLRGTSSAGAYNIISPSAGYTVFGWSTQ